MRLQKTIKLDSEDLKRVLELVKRLKKENEQLKADIRGYQDFLRALATVVEPFETEDESAGGSQ